MVKMKSVPVFLLIVFALSLWSCGEAKLDNIDVYPDSEELQVGEISSFKIRMLSDKGDEMYDPEYQWNVEGDIGSVDQSGRFKAEKTGNGIITVSSQGVTGTVKVEVKAALAEKKTEQPETIESHPADAALFNVIAIYSDIFTEHKKAPVVLNHKQHFAEYNIACVDCHHVYQDGKNVWVPTAPVKSCDSCHLLEQTEEEVKKLQTAYHNNCKNCHKEQVEAGKSEDAPYKSCTGCHRENE